MVAERQSILGISSGSRYIGVVVTRDNDLLDWRIRKIRARRLEERLTNLRRLLLRFVQRYHPSCLALKVVDPTIMSPLVSQLVEEIRTFCREEQLPVEEYSLRALKLALRIEKKGTKQDLVEALARHYPTLHMFSRRAGHTNSYHLKLIEAVAAARVCLLESATYEGKRGSKKLLA